MSEFKIISLDNAKATVSLDTIVKFSGNTEKSIKELIRNHEKTIMKFDAVSNGLLKRNLGDGISWDAVNLNESQSSFLLSLMKNTKEIVEFKFNLVREFFQAREIITQQFLEIQENRNRLTQLELKAKDKVIKQLSEIVKDYKKITKNNIVYISANGLADDKDFTAKSFRAFMKDLKLVKKVPKLTYYWEATEEGLESQLVIVDANGTPYYNHEVCTDLYLEHLENGDN